ncbi:MAG: carbohydrate ABC transporter permease [Nonomuraea sp.]|nr:carbohydrate ABC transporter permease [Nonomuraea sp.]NUP65392.1 carbohydrate ABC transporter permease [Nonomuraea sp.]NUP76644.1 carbohydrate ABC transporter permease [Nonomuraea sp.]NUS07618.1 carbohydrate ABC transporter permease [Nonomuraea sp.]NUT09650.1 carbohydrate ABC transporter permease [Nonomuraea sp.]
MSRATVNILLIISALYTLMPLTWLLFASTKSLSDLYSTPGFAFAGFNLFENIAAVAREGDGVFFRWYLNSVLYAGLGAAVSSFITVMCGYAFDKYSWLGKEKMFGLVLLGVLVPTTATAVPLYLLASEIGVVNTFWAVFVPVLVHPFGVYLARVLSAGYVPGEVLEAARSDGAGEIRTFASVALPMLLPAYVTIFLFQFTAIWNNFFLPLVMLSDQKLYPLSLGLYGWEKQGTAFPEFHSLVITGSLLSVVPLLLVFVSLQRFWKAGMTAGSVK